MVRRYAQGAEVGPRGTSFRVWAPARKKVELVVDGAHALTRALQYESNGYFSIEVDVGVGALYRYRLDGGDAFPDPASRFQPEGPHGPSQVVDPSQFAWTTNAWRCEPLHRHILYETHIGTFTREGTWASATEALPFLVDIGVTLLEIMPIAGFPGRFGWGYDGVDWYAPAHIYGTPDDVRRFVDRAHALGLGVILDVVYNHIGPNGNYLPQY
ncbi:MAG: alpha-amylase family glycosyl hydrolase, partial [Polyangiaceae bacterium]